MRELKETVAETSNGYVENSNIKMAQLGNQVSNRLLDIKSFNQIDIDQREALRRELDLTLLKCSEDYI